jgi:hypothetical protein
MSKVVSLPFRQPRAGLLDGQTASRRVAMAAVVVALLVSGNLLTLLGSAYITEGGSLAEKIHPASYLAIIAALLSLGYQMHGSTGIRRRLHAHRPLGVFLACMLFCLAYAFAFTGTGGMITLIDTFLPAGALAWALCDAPHALTQRLRRFLQILLVSNAALAIIEGICAWQPIPLPSSGGDSLPEFRPAALADHPLTGAALTILGLLLRPNPIRTFWISTAYRAVMMAALIAFGERSAIAVALMTMLALGAVPLWHTFLARRLCFREAAIAVAVAASGVVVIVAALGAGLGARLATHSYWDSSASVRLSQFNVLGLLSASELTFGCRRDDLLALVEKLRLTYHVGVIENFWLGMFATLGALCFPFFLAGIFALIAWLWRIGDRNGRAMVLSLFLAASASNSLGRKSVLLLALVACVIATRNEGATATRRPVPA